MFGMELTAQALSVRPSTINSESVGYGMVADRPIGKKNVVGYYSS